MADVLEWFKSSNILENHSIVASMPDYSEFPSLTLEQWKNWFIETAELIFSRAHPSSVILFFQSDIKHEGQWVDKAYLVQKAAEKTNIPLLWHKIFCRTAPGYTTFGRPSYSHLLCFSKELKIEATDSTPDVVPAVGEKTWARGMGTEVCLAVSQFLKKHRPQDVLLQPFCGEGALLAVANQLGINSVGIERSPKRAEKARSLEYNQIRNTWVE